MEITEQNEANIALMDDAAEPQGESEGASGGAFGGVQPELLAVEESVLVGGRVLPLTSALESLLFVADKPVSAAQLARAVQRPLDVVEAALARLDDELADQARGLRLLDQQGMWRLVTRPEAALLVEEFLNLDLSVRLSGPALETLAVVAYRQPVTRAQVEAVRGVDCGGVLRTLMQRGLIEEVGRLEGVGRPYLYGVTEQFMHHFGIVRLDELPPLAPGEEALLDAADPGLPDADPREAKAAAA